MKPTDPSDRSEPNTAVGWGDQPASDESVPDRTPAGQRTDDTTTIPDPLAVARSPHEPVRTPEPPDPTDPQPSAEHPANAATRANRPALANTERPANKTARGIPVATGESPSLPSYRVGEMLGRGGMGEVILADDLEIGRKVAIKRLRSDVTSDAMVSRFLREAKIQALLDHPAIVPVHELGRDSAGRPYFTMKRLQGTTLSEVIKTGRETRARMLRAFADVCLAIELAHARGFIHRDLKPSNIMLGEYGEVYVIDWGLARAVGETDPASSPDIGSLGGETQIGAVMGTPGYMSPEQIRAETVGTPTDVYSLGVVLYEILTRQNLHPRGADAALDSTLLGGNLSPAAAAPDRGVPPELDRLCVHALALTPELRPTARALADGVQKYLDGDRDLERRRALAEELLASARVELESDDLARRGVAMKAAGRALALDPESEEAAALVAKMMIEPPKQLPPELVKKLDESDDAEDLFQRKRASKSLLSYFVLLPIVLWMGVRDWGLVAVFYGLVTTAILITRTRWRAAPMLGIAINALLLVVLSRFTSPFLILPTMVVGIGVVFAMFPLLDRPGLVLGTSLVTLLTPIVLEAVGVWGSTWSIAGGQFTADPTAIALGDPAAKVFLIVVTLSTAMIFPMHVRSLALSQRAGRRQLEMQAWHYQHLIPDPAR